MARAVARLAEHWLKTKAQRKSQTIKLGEEDFTFFWSPWTLGQQDFVYHDMRPGEAFRPERFARVVLVKAENEAGERLFADVEKIELMSMVDPDVVKALAALILADLDKDHKAAAGDGPKA